MKTEVREWYEHLLWKNTHSNFRDKENHVALSCNGNGEHLIRVHPCGLNVKLHDNGARFAYKEAIRKAKSLHLRVYENEDKNSFDIRVVYHKEVHRLEELWKYLTGKTFNKRILNNGWWG